jgi:hypothetical protein
LAVVVDVHLMQQGVERRMFFASLTAKKLWEAAALIKMMQSPRSGAASLPQAREETLEFGQSSATVVTS